MTEIYLETIINAPPEICFNLSRSIDLHKLSLEHTNETAVGGKTAGLIEEGEFVTWRAKHFGFNQYLTVKITKMEFPGYFCDEMTKGAFAFMRHEHFFENKNGSTLMIDKFRYETPFFIFGKIFDYFVLENYMKNLLQKRNRCIKRIAESDEWRNLIR